MQLEKLKAKIKNNEITLEELNAEDILKITYGRFINYALKEEFNLTDSQIRKLRNKKNLPNADLENLIRDLIVIYDSIQTTYPDLLKYYIDEIPNIAIVSGAIRGKEKQFKTKINEIDWEHLNPQKEIIDRKIDVQFRNEKLIKRKFQIETQLIQIKEKKVLKENIPKTYNESYKPKKKPKKPKISSQTNKPQRDKMVKKRAIEKAHYLCELNPNHKTFINKMDGKPYMHGHHLILLEFEDLFPYSLDVEPNIVSLCSICHDEIHHGINYKSLIDKLYNQRKEALKECGLK